MLVLIALYDDTMSKLIYKDIGASSRTASFHYLVKVHLSIRERLFYSVSNVMFADLVFLSDFYVWIQYTETVKAVRLVFRLRLYIRILAILTSSTRGTSDTRTSLFFVDAYACSITLLTLISPIVVYTDT